MFCCLFLNNVILIYVFCHLSAHPAENGHKGTTNFWNMQEKGEKSRTRGL